MTVTEQVIEKLKALPPDKQQEVLDFVKSISRDGSSQGPLFNPEGLWENEGCDIAPEELADARREMWPKFYLGDEP